MTDALDAPAPPPEPPPPPACVRCGAALRPDARFCTACGASRDGAAPAPARAISIQGAMGEVARSTRPLKQTLVFYVIWLASGVVSSFAASLTLLVVLVADVVDAAFTFGWVLGLRRDVLRLYARFGGWRPHAVAVLGAYPIAFVTHALVTGLARAFSVPDVSLTSIYLSAGFGWTTIVLSVCVQPAVVEELAFRGVIQTTAGDVLRPVEAVLVSAAAFSIMHFSVVMFAPFVLLGAYLGWLRQASRSLYPGMLAHFLHNLLVTLHERTPVFPF